MEPTVMEKYCGDNKVDELKWKLSPRLKDSCAARSTVGLMERSDWRTTLADFPKVVSPHDSMHAHATKTKFLHILTILQNLTLLTTVFNWREFQHMGDQSESVKAEIVSPFWPHALCVIHAYVPEVMTVCEVSSGQGSLCWIKALRLGKHLCISYARAYSKRYLFGDLSTETKLIART